MRDISEMILPRLPDGPIRRLTRGNIKKTDYATVPQDQVQIKNNPQGGTRSGRRDDRNRQEIDHCRTDAGLTEPERIRAKGSLTESSHAFQKTLRSISPDSRSAEDRPSCKALLFTRECTFILFSSRGCRKNNLLNGAATVMQSRKAGPTAA